MKEILNKNAENYAKECLIQALDMGFDFKLNADFKAKKYDKENMKELLETPLKGMELKELLKSFEENNNEKTYLFGYEESYGYLVGTHARDKDAVVASLLIAEMAAYYYSKGMSLYEGLQELYKKYGYFKEETISLTLAGKEGLEKIAEIISYFRNTNIESINNKKVVEVKDYAKGIDGLPKSNVLKYFLEDESWVAVRPSGTEPKLKFYIAVKGNDEAECDTKVAGIKANIDEIVNKLK